MRTSALLLCLALTTTGAIHAQHADQKALEAAVRELIPDDDTPIFVSPLMVAPEVRGNVRIDPDNQATLEQRFNARVAEPGDVVTCTDVSRPETCRIEGSGLIFQFFMPEPVDNGVLHLAVLLLRSGTGEGGQIGREWWNLALLRRPNLGWTVVHKELTNTADGAW